MAQAVALAEGRPGASPPAELSLFFMAQGYSALPESGGLNDQDARTMSYMGTLGSIYHAVKRIRGAKGEAIHNLDDGDRETWQRLIDLGVMD